MDRRRYEVELEMQAKLGASYGMRRAPRVRRVKGRAGLFLTIDERRTKRAAFRSARRLRARLGRLVVARGASDRQWWVLKRKAS